jgi:lipopolysaccharide/colanic/teichoic acid biosynthesis glycosyltransferase
MDERIAEAPRQSKPAAPAAQPVREVVREPVRPRRPGYLPLKTVVEWFVALMIFIAAAPLIGVLLLLVRMTSPGPGLYCQTRLGRNGRKYTMFKIRSMTHNCEAATGAVWCQGHNDSRVTRIGRLLRQTHLDELPQLLNVLRGEMSLIGPRPERPEIVKQIEAALPRYHDRMEVRPGITGFAQIQHPADLDLDHVRRKLNYDLYYVREISPWLDFRIGLGTILYFMGVTFSALCKLMLHGQSKAVEQESEEFEMPAELQS